MLGVMLYFDHNATSPVMREAREAWLETTEKIYGNPSSPHAFGRAAQQALTEAREQLAAHLGCHPADILWTSGATEANNTVLHHFARTLDARAEVWISAIEHPCVHEAARYYFGSRVRFIPVTRAGVVDVEWFTEEIADRRPGLVGVMAANNETGVLQPWRELLAICQSYEVPFFCDAVQWIGKLPAKGLGECDYLTGAAHKFGGPRGVGFLKVPRGSKIQPLLHGGKQERGQRAGTENVPVIVAMLAALNAREKQLARRDQQARAEWKEKFERLLVRQVRGATIVGAGAPRLWNTTSVLMPDPGHLRWVARLDKAGFAVSTGSACTTGREEPSRVLTAMGFKPHEVTHVLRFSSGWETTASDWEALEKGIVAVYHQIHSGADAARG